MYYIERYANNTLGWVKIPFTESKTRSYCDGYIDAFDSMYPSNPIRIVKIDGNETKVVRETKGKGKVHLN